MDALPDFSGSESLGSPAFTDPTLSNPAQITSASDMHWQDMASPTLGYPLDETGAGTGTNHFDVNTWLGGDHLQPPSTMLHNDTFSGEFMTHGNSAEPNTHDLGINTSPYQQFDAPLDISHMNDWPNIDSDATKEFLGMLDSSTADLGLNTNGWDSHNMFPMAHGNAPPETMFNATENASAGHVPETGQEKKDQGGGGGGCCS